MNSECENKNQNSIKAGKRSLWTMNPDAKSGPRPKRRGYKLLPARGASRGFTLLLSVLIASLLLSIGLSIFNIALKELILSSAGRDSQFAFYAADSGAECALYWDIKESAFPTTTPSRTITCNNQSFVVGGGESSSFTMNFPPEAYCATVSVLKQGEATTIESRGYNTCSQQNPRRVERGIRVRY